MVSKICPALHIDPNRSYSWVQVPTVVIFTKMDALDDRAYNELIRQGQSFIDAGRQAPSIAAVRFREYYLNKLDGVRHPPSDIIRLRGMYTALRWKISTHSN